MSEKDRGGDKSGQKSGNFEKANKHPSESTRGDRKDGDKPPPTTGDLGPNKR